MATLLEQIPIAIPYLGGREDLPPAVGAFGLAPRATDKQIFRLPDGQAWRYCGLSAFPLCDRFARGADLAAWLGAFPGYNTLRVWPYVGPGWGAAQWNTPPHEVILEAIRECARLYFVMELTLLTDDDPARLPWAESLVEYLAAAQCPNLLIEIGNEPLTNKRIEVERLREVCAASGYLYASGVYEDEKLAFGTYGTAHTARTEDWARRAHDLMEYYNGAGPHAPHAGLPVPWVADEPIRPDSLADDRTTRLDYRGYGAVSALLGAGATFHSEAGKHLHPATDLERACAAELLAGLLAYPPEAPLGPYSRIVEPGGTGASRCYVVGPHMARVRPPQPTPPAGYVAIDDAGVICRQG